MLKVIDISDITGKYFPIIPEDADSDVEFVYRAVMAHIYGKDVSSGTVTPEEMAADIFGSCYSSDEMPKGKSKGSRRKKTKTAGAQSISKPVQRGSPSLPPCGYCDHRFLEIQEMLAHNCQNNKGDEGVKGDANLKLGRRRRRRHDQDQDQDKDQDRKSSAAMAMAKSYRARANNSSRFPSRMSARFSASPIRKQHKLVCQQPAKQLVREKEVKRLYFQLNRGSKTAAGAGRRV